jgi:hypothetical protein
MATCRSRLVSLPPVSRQLYAQLQRRSPAQSPIRLTTGIELGDFAPEWRVFADSLSQTGMFWRRGSRTEQSRISGSRTTTSARVLFNGTHSSVESYRQCFQAVPSKCYDFGSQGRRFERFRCKCIDTSYLPIQWQVQKCRKTNYLPKFCNFSVEPLLTGRLRQKCPASWPPPGELATRARVPLVTYLRINAAGNPEPDENDSRQSLNLISIAVVGLRLTLAKRIAEFEKLDRSPRESRLVIRQKVR